MLKISPAPPCIAEFAKLREEAEKKGKAAKAADQRHVTRMEMCEYVTAYATVEERWIDFTEAGVRTCGIPTGILSQLQEVHARTERATCRPQCPVAAMAQDTYEGRRHGRRERVAAMATVTELEPTFRKAPRQQ